MIQSSFLSSSFGNSESDSFQDFPSIVDLPALSDFIHNPFSNDTNSPYELPVFDEITDYLPISDNFVSTILEDDIVGFTDDWLSSLDNTNQLDSKPIINDQETVSNHKSSNSQWQSSKLWSDMSPAVQLETLHALSELVTYHMTIREQIEIIKIIDPNAVISPEDKEFALDNSFMNDVKLKKIRDFIRKLKLPSRQSNSSSVPTGKSSGCKLFPRKNSNVTLSRSKRKPKKQKTVPTDDVAIIRKRRKQNKKEEKSGLFLHETKVKLINPLEEDEDVNILE